MEKIIGVDLDEVLSETINDILKHHNYMFNNIPITRGDIGNYYIHYMPKYKVNDAYSKRWFDDFLNSDKANHLKPVAGALKKLTALKKKGYTLFIVTARPEKLADLTWKWIHLHFPGLFDKIIFANHLTVKSIEKADICVEAGIEVMIEDNLDYAIKLAEKGIKVYLLDKPWNKRYDPAIHKNIIKVKKRKEIDL